MGDSTFVLCLGLIIWCFALLLNEGLGIECCLYYNVGFNQEK